MYCMQGQMVVDYLRCRTVLYLGRMVLEDHDTHLAVKNHRLLWRRLGRRKGDSVGTRFEEGSG